jgi:hypothetical protein
LVFLLPPEFILPSERFDISLLKRDDQPIITIETKKPGHDSPGIVAAGNSEQLSDLRGGGDTERKQTP